MKKTADASKLGVAAWVSTWLLLACMAHAPVQAASAGQPPRAANPQASAARLPHTPLTPQIPHSRQLSQLLGDYYQANARFNPIGATFSGDNRFDDQLGMGIAPKPRALQLKRYRGFAKRLQAINPAGLSRTDRISYEILDFELAAAFSFAPFPEHLMPIDQMGGLPVVIANFASGKGSQPLDTPRQYSAYLNRLTQLSGWTDQAIVNMRLGIQTGVVLPKALVIAMLPQYQKLVSAKPDASVYFTPIKNMPSGFSAADQRVLAADYSREIERRLNPALGRLAAFLEKEYLPAARTTAGWGGLPQGADWYAASVAASTITALRSDQIHAIGLREVLRIQQHFAELGPKMGYTGPAVDLPKWVAAQARYYPFKTEQEINDTYRKLNQTLQAKLPSLFTLQPKAPLEIRAEPELTRATASDHYTPPSDDGLRPGIFWSVVNDPTRYPKVKMTTLFLHEASPGHHFQIALQMQQKLPAFRKFGGNTAYAEGWALYAETLGKELGLYDEPDQYFGHLNFELLRAARLVVDTGLHAQGWTLVQAVAYLRETLGETQEGAKSAIERYMAWPAQALAYKVGSMKIMELRERAAIALGTRFSLAAFHTVVLDEGALPLAVLEAKVDRWIAESR